ncbi:NAD(+) diphosphatase [Marinobacter santoriniensis]|nr:NAD(+) diphosphatase [Marinobacter santoriniensis]
MSTSDWNPGWTTEPPDHTARFLLVSGSDIVKPRNGWLHAGEQTRLQDLSTGPVSLGTSGERPLYVAEISELPPEAEPVSLREALLAGEEAPAALLSTGLQVLQWWRDHRYCGRCGQETGLHARERAKWCDACGIPWYPRIAPCVIVVIRKQDRFLLAKNARVKRHFYSLIAGFVEAGETLEEAVAREVLEETGLTVNNIRYQGSQPWPFPHQLMVGFFADYVDGSLVLQEDELSDAGWFAPGDTPPIPPETTIAGRLIQAMEREIAGDVSAG